MVFGFRQKYKQLFGLVSPVVFDFSTSKMWLPMCLQRKKVKKQPWTESFFYAEVGKGGKNKENKFRCEVKEEERSLHKLSKELFGKSIEAIS